MPYADHAYFSHVSNQHNIKRQKDSKSKTPHNLRAGRETGEIPPRWKFPPYHSIVC